MTRFYALYTKYYSIIKTYDFVVMKVEVATVGTL
jgi:hypothetical protein